MSNANPISELLRITSQLTDLLDREAEMLLAMKPSEIQALHPIKVALSAAYESQIKNLKANPTVLQSIPTEMRSEFRGKIGKFQASLLANYRNLHAARLTTESTLRAIADEVQTKTEKHAGYTANGTTGRTSKPGRTSARAFAFDQIL